MADKNKLPTPRTPPPDYMYPPETPESRRQGRIELLKAFVFAVVIVALMVGAVVVLRQIGQ